MLFHFGWRSSDKSKQGGDAARINNSETVLGVVDGQNTQGVQDLRQQTWVLALQQRDKGRNRARLRHRVLSFGAVVHQIVENHSHLRLELHAASSRYYKESGNSARRGNDCFVLHVAACDVAKYANGLL